MFDLTIDFRKLRDDLIPRYKELNNFLKVLIIPIANLYELFLGFRSLSHYEIIHNSQVIYLRKVLNNRFNTDLIEIKDGVNLDDNYIYRKVELKALMIYRKSENENITTLYRKEEYLNIIDFVVEIPLSLNLSSSELIELTAIVTKYKLPNKNFKIVLV